MGQLDKSFAVMQFEQDIAVEVASIFSEDTSELLAELRQYVSRNNTIEVRELLHKLKGSVSYIGVEEDFRCVENAHAKIKHSGVDKASKELAILEKRMMHLIGVLNHELLQFNEQDEIELPENSFLLDV
ncbi:Hpt domain-containing protein [Thalassotalea euphylliae]|uniref:Hpt domain-containing protein n=1 Tax=Thalassotalea euphylliae TaxID=1655234 RepID=UPI00363E3752